MKKVLNIIPILVIIMLIFPYLGSLGASVFAAAGKFYYAFISVICLIYFAFKLPKFTAKRNHKIKMIFMLFLVFYLLFFIFIRNSLDNVFFGLILFIFFAFSFVAYRGVNLKYIGLISTIALYLFLVITVINKCTYFNPNSYAFISSELYFWSIFYLEFKKKNTRRVMFVINTIAELFLCYIVYNSATQLICVAFFAFLFMIRRIKFMKSKAFYYLFVIGIFLFVMLLPIVTVYFIDKGVLDLTFFTNRGERWVWATDGIKEVGIFNVYAKDIGAHNGYMEMALKYSLVFATVYMIILFIALLSCYKIYRRNKFARTLIFIFMTFILMNCSESFFVGLTDAYFLVITFASLISFKCVNMKKRGVRRYCNGNEVTC